MCEQPLKNVSSLINTVMRSLHKISELTLPTAKTHNYLSYSVRTHISGVAARFVDGLQARVKWQMWNDMENSTAFIVYAVRLSSIRLSAKNQKQIVNVMSSKTYMSQLLAVN